MATLEVWLLMANPHPKKPRKKHPWRLDNQASFDAEIEGKAIKLKNKRAGWDDRTGNGNALFGSGRGMKKR